MVTTTVTAHSKGEAVAISTPNGTVRITPYVSSGGSDGLKTVLRFAPRYSSFDRENTKSQNDQFRGFFTLFWIGLAITFMRTSLDSWDTNRTLLSLNFGRLITRDAVMLAVADLIMVSAMLLSVPFVKCLQRGYFNYYYTGVMLQVFFESCFVCAAVAWGVARDWYWVQAGFMVLHSLSCIMKVHSYIAHNGMLATVYSRLQVEKRTLADYIARHGGHEAALERAAKHQAELEAIEASAPEVSTPATPQIVVTNENENGNGNTNGNGNVDNTRLLRQALESGAALRRRKRSSLPAKNNLPLPTEGLPRGTSLEPSHSTSPHTPRDPNPLAWSPDRQIALLARNIDEMEDELRSNGKKGLVWPENLTYRNFVEFQFFPTLVYELEYPRTTTIRPLYILEKTLATFGTFSLIYTLTEHYIMPHSPQPTDSILHTFLNLALPMMINFLLIFYIIFECICPAFAELSCFADRELYGDWWNSTSWDEFSRKWNKPVHVFLLRHVYSSSRNAWNFSKWQAAFFTFFLSALAHELVMAVVSKKIRPYLFLMQISQIPLIAIGRLPIVRRNRTLGNIVFWLGLMIGFPLLEICYLVY